MGRTLALTATIGVPTLGPLDSRMARAADGPSITGICMSMRIRSKVAARADSTASAPS